MRPAFQTTLQKGWLRLVHAKKKLHRSGPICCYESISHQPGQSHLNRVTILVERVEPLLWYVTRRKLGYRNFLGHQFQAGCAKTSQITYNRNVGYSKHRGGCCSRSNQCTVNSGVSLRSFAELLQLLGLLLEQSVFIRGARIS